MDFVMEKMIAILAKAHDPWFVVGIVGQIAFGSRFIVQWIVSEIKGRSVIPISFWYLSIVGSLLLLTYAFYENQLVFILGLLFNTLIYGRNLFLIYAGKKKDATESAAIAMIRGEFVVDKPR